MYIESDGGIHGERLVENKNEKGRKKRKRL